MKQLEHRPSDTFIGRQAELKMLQRAADDSFAGRGRLVLLAGDPGSGKTRTSEELAAYATHRAPLFAAHDFQHL